jgi:N-acetylmuramoyl-L-alanine amidase
VKHAVWLVLAVVALSMAGTVAGAQPLGAGVTPDRSQIYVAGRLVRFEHLSDANGAPFVPIDDPGLRTLLSLVGARSQYQPGTRFVVFTRADGKLVTFTVGSNAMTVDDESQGIPAAPFTQADRLYIPVMSLSQALGLSSRAFSGGYAFSPELVSVTRLVGQRRTIVQVQATGPLSWRSAYGHVPKKPPALTLTFPGFENSAGSKVALGGREAKEAVIAQQGPPGYPITTLTLEPAPGVKFAVHRTSNVSMDLILARDEKDLALATAAAPAPSVQLRPASAIPSAQSTPIPTPLGAPYSAGVPTAVPAPEATEANASPAATSSPEPEGSGASPSASGAPLAKVLQVGQAEAPGVSRIALTLSGPVSFEWHRLADPDNRFWIDISQAELVGASQNLTVKLPTIKSVTVSQNELVPDHVVRIAISPTQPVDVEIGPIAGSPNTLGIDIRSGTPAPDAPSSGVGSLVFATAPPAPRPVVYSTYIPTDPRLIVIDPGHGGNDPGAINESMGLTEKNLTLTISKRLKADLQHAGWHVAMTRDGDYEVGDPIGNDKQELQARCDVANAAGARLFISVHINASVSSEPNGVTTYWWRDDARAFANDVQNAIVSGTGIHDDGIIRNNFYVIHHTMMPGVLVEVAYLSNDHDAQLLSQGSFLDRVADDIAQGVGTFTGGPPSR